MIGLILINYSLADAVQSFCAFSLTALLVYLLIYALIRLYLPSYRLSSWTPVWQSLRKVWTNCHRRLSPSVRTELSEHFCYFII